jgi:hypothetical protein
MAEAQPETIRRREFLKGAGASVGGALLGQFVGKSALAGRRGHSTVLPGRGPANFTTISEFVKNPPFSFVYGGHTSGPLLRNWPAHSWRRWMWQFNLPRYGGNRPTPMLTTSGAISGLLP